MLRAARVWAVNLSVSAFHRDSGRAQRQLRRPSGETSRPGQKWEPRDGPGIPGLTAASWRSLVFGSQEKEALAIGSPALGQNPERPVGQASLNWLMNQIWSLHLDMHTI